MRPKLICSDAINGVGYFLLRLGFVTYAFVTYTFVTYAFADSDTETFTPQTLSVNLKITTTPQKLNLTGDAADEVMLIGLSDDGEKKIDIIGYKSPSNEAVILKSFTLDNDIYAWDISEVKNNTLQKIYLLGKDKIYVIDQTLNLKSITDLLPNLHSMFLTNESDTFIHQDFVKYLNQDDKDDFIIPYFTEVSVWLSDKDQFHHQILPIPSVMEAGRREFIFKPRTLYFNSFSQNRTTDIALVEQGRILYYPIGENGKYDFEPTAIQLSSTIYGVQWWDVPGNDLDNADHSNVNHRAIEDITDINGDDIPDLIVNMAKSKSLLSKTNDIEFYFGQLENNKVVYTQESQSLISTGTTVTPRIVDIDGDDKKEILITSFKLSLKKIISVLLTGKADINVFIFGISDGEYANEPVVSKSVEMKINLSSGVQRFPMFRLIDINGDKLKDILLSEDDDEMKIYLAQTNNDSQYARKGFTYKFAMPSNTNRIIDADINGDGKDDLVATYTAADGPEKMNQVTVLFSIVDAN